MGPLFAIQLVGSKDFPYAFLYYLSVHEEKWTEADVANVADAGKVRHHDRSGEDEHEHEVGMVTIAKTEVKVYYYTIEMAIIIRTETRMEANKTNSLGQVSTK